MNCLIIGNGFDIAHGLHTKYNDFMDFVNNKNFYNNLDLSVLYKQEKIDLFKKDNIIINYINQSINDNWIDVENKLLELITCIFGWQKHLDIKYHNKFASTISDTKLTTLIFKNDINYDETINNVSKLNSILVSLLFPNSNGLDSRSIPGKSMNDIYILQDRTIHDFFDFIKIFTEYLKIVNCTDSTQINFFKERHYDLIISFNYTNTYERLYDENIEINYVHGNIFDDNIVLGIGSDYYDPSYNDKSLYFYKFFQRIAKNSNTNFHTILDIQPPAVLDIYGHSLDPTDEDIIKYCIEKSHLTNIYYIDEQDKYNKIANLTKIYGKDKLMDLTLSCNKRINFVKIKKA